MLSRLFTRGLQMELGGQRMEWRTPGEMDAVLRSRTGPSARRLAAIGRLDGPARRRETEQLGRLLDRVETLLRSGGDEFLDTAELLDLPDDQDWREILSGLRALGSDGAEWRVQALRRFAEYLASGQDLFRALRHADGDAPGEVRPRGEDGQETLAGARQKLLFDLDLLLDGESSDKDLARLPKGETVAIAMQPHQSLTIMLARYRFLLVSGSPFLLTDDSGHDVKLPAGKSVVGRSSEADVTVDTGYRAVSRRHLMVETGADGLLRLTDISSLGTFVPKDYLGKILH